LPGLFARRLGATGSTGTPPVGNAWAGRSVPTIADPPPLTGLDLPLVVV
jgi:hypothetical protein